MRVHVQQMLDGYTLRNDDRFAAAAATILLSRESLDAQILAQKQAVDIALQAADRAVSKAESATEKRFDSVNEFRAALNDTARLQMPRAEIEALFKGLTDKMVTGLQATDARIIALGTRVTEQRSERTGMESGWGYAVGAIGVVVAIISVVAAVFFRVKGL